MDLERAEAPAELDVIGGREPLLVAEDEDRMLLEGAADAEEIRFRQGLRKIEANDLGAQHGRQWPYRKIHRRSSSGGAFPRHGGRPLSLLAVFRLRGIGQPGRV